MDSEEIENARAAALYKAHDFYLWVGEHVKEKDMVPFLLEAVGAAMLSHAEMAAHMKAALKSGDPALIRQTAEQWIAFDLLAGPPAEDGRR